MSFALELVPMLAVDGAHGALAFYQNAFGADIVSKIVDDDGTVAHAELRIGSARFMLSDESPEHGALAPTTLGGSPVLLLMLVENLEAALARAVDAGAVVDRPLQEGIVRNAKVRDPFGHRWMLAGTPVTTPSSEMESQ